MYPDADIPCVQVSLQAGLDPAEHIRIGGALAGLADDNVLVLGSGFSFHNLQVLLRGQTDGADEANAAFEAWLIETCTSHDIDEVERQHRLVDWSSAPGARFCHPREEHLIPLHVCYGVARAPCRDHAALTVMGRRCSSYFW